VDSIKTFNGAAHLQSALVSLIKNAWSCTSTPPYNFMIWRVYKNSYRFVFTLHSISRNFAPSLSLKMDIRLLFAINPLKPELNSICYLLALLAHHFLHVSRIRVKSLTLRRLMSYIYMEHPFLMFLDHTQRRSTVGRTPLDE